MSLGANDVGVSSMAARGGLLVTDTELHAGDWSSIQTLGEAVIASITFPDHGGAATNVTINGSVVAPISSITLTSGAVLLGK